MEAKYYTPQIEEFYIGFEYEYYYHPIFYKFIDDKSKTWEKRVYTGEDFKGIHYDVEGRENVEVFLQLKRPYLDYKEFIRVKYLDAQDIESLIHKNAEDYHTIFKLRNSYEDELIFQTYWIEENEFLDEDYIYWDIKYNQIKITHKSKTLFWGKIKNLSEFKKLLAQLGIE